VLSYLCAGSSNAPLPKSCMLPFRQRQQNSSSEQRSYDLSCHDSLDDLALGQAEYGLMEDVSQADDHIISAIFMVGQKLDNTNLILKLGRTFLGRFKDFF
jgi:hypothetical protein